jgi:hypothetical protein
MFNVEDKNLLEGAWTQYRFGIEFSEILKSALDKITAVNVAKEHTTISVIDKHHWVDYDYYSLEEMVDLGIDQELVEFLNKPSVDYPNFRKLVKDFYENLVPIELGAEFNFRKAFDFDNHFLKNKIWFASDGSVTESFKYEYVFRPSVLKQMGNIKKAEEFQTFLKMYYTESEIAVVEREPQDVNILSSFFEPDVIITEKMVARALVKYIAYKQFLAAYPLEFVEVNGTNKLIGKSKEQFDAHLLTDSRISKLTSTWKGSKSELSALLFSFHKAGYLSGTMEDVLRTFQDLMPDEDKIVSTARASLLSGINTKDNNATGRFRKFLDKLMLGYEELYDKHRKN